MDVFLKLCVLVAGVQSYDVLTKNFFENLEGHPFIAGKSLTPVSKRFIEAQITNYVHLVTGEESHSRKKKRSLLDKFTKSDTGIHLLTGLKPSATVPVRFPEDIEIFQQNSKWFAAALESPGVKEHANYLVVFAFANSTFSETARTPIVNGARLATIKLDNSTLIAVAENDAAKSSFHNKSGIYQFGDDVLVKIQSIDMHYASDVVFWKMHDDIYMAISQFMSNGYDFEIPIYKWLGKHFDLVQSIGAKAARKITPFVIDSTNFLAVANFKDVEGNTRIYSELYKYDYHVEKYELYQRILTRACTDIEVFTFRHDRRKDTFLVVANSYDKDSDGEINYETDSIVYKFVDGYFIPFQSIQVAAVQRWIPIQSSYNFVLFASSRFEGLKAFQYDGWSFMEVPQKLPEILTKTGIKSVRLASFNNSTIVVANKNNNGKVANVFRLEFKHEKRMNDIYHDMMRWCDHGLKKVEELSSATVFDVVVGKAERGDIEEEDDDDNEDKFEDKEIESRIESLTRALDELDVDIPGEITADEVIFNNVTFIKNLNTTTLNDLNVDDFLENVLDIDDGFEIEEATIDSIDVDDLIDAKNVNGRDINTLVHGSDDLAFDSVAIRGTLTVPEGATIDGRLNGVSITEQNLLLREGDQKFSQTLQINVAQVENLSTKLLNGENLTSLRPSNTTPIPINYIEDLIVTDLTVGGYINDVDVPTLQKHALRKTGNQEITTFVFDFLYVKNLEVLGQISERNPSDLIPTDAGVYSINQDIIFKNNVFIDDFHVLNFFNGIETKDGMLDVLLKNHSLEQEITGDKTFDDVIINEAIWLQGHINSKNLEKMNPVVSINDNVFLEGDKTITGSVEVESFVQANDVSTSDGTYSFGKLEAEGLRLSAKEVKPHLYFLQQLNVDDLFVDTINGRSPRSFVVTGTEDPQIIEGVKIFSGDLQITGATSALKINGVDVEDLENSVMWMKGDQIITGKHHIRHIAADKILSNVTTFDKNLTVLASTFTENLTIYDSVKVGVVNAKTLSVKGRVNGLPFDDIVNDTVTRNTSRVIGGHKYFRNVTTDVLNVENSVVIDQIPDAITELRLDGPLNIKNIKIENLYFDNECNGVGKESFDSFDGAENGTTVSGDQDLDTVIIYGDVYIASNKIGDVGIDALVNDSVKVDEPHEFDFANFESVISKSPVQLGGHIENFDFENALLPDQLESIISDEKKFKNNLTINGSVNFEELVNGFNMTQFCMFAMGEMENKNLTVLGNAFFAKGPKLGHINGAKIKKIKEKAWFSHTETILSGSVDFEDVLFKNDIEVDGFVDNISLSLLQQNYFSKTKDQNIPATFTFENGLIFESELTVPNITLNSGVVNGVNVDEFVRTALLDDYDQVFESPVFFENCFVENLSGEFTVNDWELDKDVMRYDKVNMVTGTKIFKNLNVNSLKLDRNIKIQDVDVLDWFKNSVLTTTSFNVTGKKSFKDAVFRNGFQLAGTLNEQVFDLDNIMVKDIPQDVAGTKTIHAEPVNPVIFKGIKLKGLLNEIDVDDLINNQAYKNQPNVFKTSLNLYNNISTNNLVIKKMYQGMNMSELIINVTNLGVLNNLLNEYEKLLDMSYKLKESIEDQAYFLHQYKIVQTMRSVTNSQKMLCPDGATRLGILVTENSATRMDLYEWHEQEEQFLMNATIHFGKRPDYVDQVFMGRYLYTEGNDGMGHFTLMSNPLTPLTPTATNLTTQTTSFTLPTTNERCTLFIYMNSPPRIFCEKSNQIELRQVLSPLASKASSVTISGSLYLIIITQPLNGIEARTDLWRLNNDSYFSLHQSLFEAHPQSVSTATYDGFHYLAIASGHVPSAMYSGTVEILRFDENTLRFIPWQSLELDAPTQVEFSVLPTQELVLFVVTDDPTEPLLVFRYEGITGFQLKITGSALPHVSYMNQFMGGAGQHFIVAQSYDEMNVVRAIFKGEKVA